MLVLARVLLLTLVMIVLGAGVASGQEYPNKTIRIVTSTPGGGNDFSARLGKYASAIRSTHK